MAQITPILLFFIIFAHQYAVTCFQAANVKQHNRSVKPFNKYRQAIKRGKYTVIYVATKHFRNGHILQPFFKTLRNSDHIQHPSVKHIGYQSAANLIT